MIARVLQEVSIHAPVKGATLHFGNKSVCYARFNPRAREGRDKVGNTEDYALGVSIHAPVKGATHDWRRCQYGQGCFNPRAREGRDSETVSEGINLTGFNPRAREGRDECS